MNDEIMRPPSRERLEWLLQQRDKEIEELKKKLKEAQIAITGTEA